ncbi:MAG: hypothetical protein U1F42_09810 [Candidatus Competibacteraceae bacterium]
MQRSGDETMQELQSGQNYPIGAGRIAVGVTGEPREDFIAKTQQERCCWPPMGACAILMIS